MPWTFRTPLCFVLLVSISLLFFQHQKVHKFVLDESASLEGWSRIDNIRGPNEFRISPSDEKSAMETLVDSGMTGVNGLLPEKKSTVDEHFDAMKTLIDAGYVKQKDVFLTELKPPASDTTQTNTQTTPMTQSRKMESKILSPCDKDPSHLDCSEYPAGIFTPHYANAVLGPTIKVPGVIRAVNDDTSNLDSQGRENHPEDEFDYEMRWLTSPPDSQHLHKGFPDNGSTDQDLTLSTSSTSDSLPEDGASEYIKAAFGQGVDLVDPSHPSDQTVPLPTAPPPTAGQEFIRASMGPSVITGPPPLDRLVPLTHSAAVEPPAGREYDRAALGAGVEFFNGPRDTYAPPKAPSPAAFEGSEFHRASMGPGVLPLDLAAANDRGRALPAARGTAESEAPQTSFEFASRGPWVRAVNPRLADDRSWPGRDAVAEQPDVAEKSGTASTDAEAGAAAAEASGEAEQTAYEFATGGPFVRTADPRLADDRSWPGPNTETEEARLAHASGEAAASTEGEAGLGGEGHSVKAAAEMARTMELADSSAAPPVGSAAAGAAGSATAGMAPAAGDVEALLDALVADLKAACEQTAKRKAGFEWKGRQCLYKGRPMREQSNDLRKDPVPLRPDPPPGSVDQFGWHSAPAAGGDDGREALLDALVVDLKKACEETAKRKAGFEWKGRQCLYKGVPMREQGDDLRAYPVPLHPFGVPGPAGQVDQAGWRPADGPSEPAAAAAALREALVADLRAACLKLAARKEGIAWSRGACRYHGLRVAAQADDLRQAPVLAEHSGLDGPPGTEDQHGWRPAPPPPTPPAAVALRAALEADLRTLCERVARRKPGYTWRDGRCLFWGQPAREQPADLSQPPTLLSAEPTGGPPPGVEGSDRVWGDVETECRRVGGHLQYKYGPARALCVSKQGCGTVTSTWETDCGRPGAPGVLWSVPLKPGQGAFHSAFNPAQPDEPAGGGGAAPPLQVSSEEWQRQTGWPRPLAYRDADLRGRDVGGAALTTRRPAGPGWTEGRAAGGERWYYNHGTGELRWRVPAAAAAAAPCTRARNGDPAVAGCSWEERVEASTGRRYWYNLGTHRSTWADPFETPDQAARRRARPAAAPPRLRPGTWSGTPGGNAYWTPQLARAALGPHVQVLDARVGRRRASCGGQSGECVPGQAAGPGTPGNPDAFDPARYDDGSRAMSRGPAGAEWDRAAAAAAARPHRAGAKAVAKAQRGGASGWYSAHQFSREVPAELRAGGGGGAAARQQSLAEIYGVAIADRDARRFFGRDDQRAYVPSPAATRAYLQRLVARAAAAAAASPNGTLVVNASEVEEAAKEANRTTAWPARPSFAPGTGWARQWCALQGGSQMVRCRLGRDGAWRAEPADAGAWGLLHGRDDGPPLTLVGQGVWTLPGPSSPYLARAADALARAPRAPSPLVGASPLAAAEAAAAPAAPAT